MSAAMAGRMRNVLFLLFDAQSAIKEAFFE
jgi:hypothetical protein